jgi:hypothetical protein
MPYCSKCGVEVEESVERCPLCSAPIQRFDGSGSPVLKPYPDHVINPDAAPLPLHERLKIALEIVSVFLGIALAVIILVDLLYSKRLTWSVYPTAAIAYLWLCLAMPVFLLGRPWLVFAVLGPATILFVFLLDAYDGSIDWFLSYGLPITGLSVIVIFAVTLSSALSKRRGLNVAGFALLGAAVLCMGIDLTIMANITGRLKLSWSEIVALILMPASALLLYFHFRITKKKDLRKVFHI